MGRLITLWNAKDLGRMLQWLIVSLMLLIVVALIAPQQIGVIVKQCANVALFGWLGYWFDRSVYPDARPSDQTVCSNPIASAAAQLRRAVIIASFVVGGGQGL